jgi:hypothetical protein
MMIDVLVCSPATVIQFDSFNVVIMNKHPDKVYFRALKSEAFTSCRNKPIHEVDVTESSNINNSILNKLALLHKIVDVTNDKYVILFNSSAQPYWSRCIDPWRKEM